MTTDAPAPLRPLRADAARNREAILGAARTAFAEGGLDVGVEEIARRAGVGKGTLYRRFPTKEALVRAILEDRLVELERLEVASREQADAGAAFAAFLAEIVTVQSHDRGFLDAVNRALGAGSLSPEQRHRYVELTGRPLRRAQAEGSVRGDLDPEDVPILLRMAGAATRPALDGEPMDERWPRYLELLLDGLRRSRDHQ